MIVIEREFTAETWAEVEEQLAEFIKANCDISPKKPWYEEVDINAC